jgi:hypothetical protein
VTACQTLNDFNIEFHATLPNIAAMKRILTILVATISFSALPQIYDTNNDVAQVFAGAGQTGFLDAQGTLAIFNNPSAIVSDSSSNLFVWDANNYRIRKVTPDANVTTFIGGGTGSLPGYGTSVSLSGYQLGASVIDSENTIWIAGRNNYSSAAGILVVGSNGYTEFLSFGSAYINGLTVDSQNNLYFGQGSQVFKLSSTGILTVFAGSQNNTGSTDGNGIYALFNAPSPIAADAARNVYVWDTGNHLIRRIDQSQNVVTIAGNGSGTDVDGTGFGAHFSWIYAGYADINGNIYLACGSTIRKMDAATNVVTLAGSFSSPAYANGAGALARFSGATGLCPSQGKIFVADSNNQRIRLISFNPQPVLVTPPSLGISNYVGVTITGLVGRAYQVQSSRDLTNWTTATTFLLPSSPYLWIDPNSISGKKFYRAFLMP